MAKISEIEDAQRKMWGEPKPHRVVYVEIDPNEIKGRVIRCPGYNNDTLSVYGWCWRQEVSQARKPKFMEALRESLRQEGCRNPIVVYAFKEGVFLSFGGSRLLCAREVGLERIPTICNDYAGTYKEAPEVTEENFARFFADVPRYFEITPYGADTHYALERNRRHEYDAAGFNWAKDLEDQEFIGREFSWLSDYKPTGDDNGRG